MHPGDCNREAHLGRVVLNGCGSRLLPRLDGRQGPVCPHEGLLGGLVCLRYRGSQLKQAKDRSSAVQADNRSD